MKNTTRKAVIFGILIPLMFGFLLWGGGSGSNGFVAIKSSNKVFAPSFLSNTFSGSASFNFQPVFRPTFQPVFGNIGGSGAFRFNFFDP